MSQRNAKLLHKLAVKSRQPIKEIRRQYHALPWTSRARARRETKAIVCA